MYYLYKNINGSLIAFRDGDRILSKELTAVCILFKDDKMQNISSEYWIEELNRHPVYHLEDMEHRIIYKSESYDDLVAYAAVLKL